MSKLKVGVSTIVYDNPLPMLRSRHGYFPNLVQLKDGRLLCSFVLAEAMESVDACTRIAQSIDGGKTWELMPLVYSRYGIIPISDSLKVSVLEDGCLVLFGYEFKRTDSDKPIGNPATGGLLEDEVMISFSEDKDIFFSQPNYIPCVWGPHVEASAPMYQMADGTLATPITGFPTWEGTLTDCNCGRLLRSEDGGKSFSDSVICMAFPNNNITCFEQRMTQTASGMLVVIGWNENMETGQRLPNHYTISIDGGETFSEPQSTGVMGQASNVYGLNGERILVLHAVRRDTDRTGIYGYICDVSGGGWRPESDPMLLWEPATPIVKDTKMAEIFSFLKFGQPSAIQLQDGRILMTHWAVENGQGRIYSTELFLY